MNLLRITSSIILGKENLENRTTQSMWLVIMNSHIQKLRPS